MKWIKRKMTAWCFPTYEKVTERCGEQALQMESMRKAIELLNQQVLRERKECAAEKEVLKMNISEDLYATQLDLRVSASENGKLNEQIKFLESRVEALEPRFACAVTDEPPKWTPEEAGLLHDLLANSFGKKWLLILKWYAQNRAVVATQQAQAPFGVHAAGVACGFMEAVRCIQELAVDHTINNSPYVGASSYKTRAHRSFPGLPAAARNKDNPDQESEDES